MSYTVKGNNIVTMRDMINGDVGILKEGPYSNALVKCINNYVFIVDGVASDYWGDPSNCSLNVEILPSGTVIELIVP